MGKVHDVPFEILSVVGPQPLQNAGKLPAAALLMLGLFLSQGAPVPFAQSRVSARSRSSIGQIFSS